MERDDIFSPCIDIFCISTHTLTWSVTWRGHKHSCRSSNFNSHAHVERDFDRVKIPAVLSISTHTLTWSVTSTLAASNHSKTISTHTLTWSVTLAGAVFNVVASISTHTLTWSVTKTCWIMGTLWLFQLTRSRGA